MLIPIFWLHVTLRVTSLWVLISHKILNTQFPPHGEGVLKKSITLPLPLLAYRCYRQTAYKNVTWHINETLYLKFSRETQNILLPLIY